MRNGSSKEESHESGVVEKNRGKFPFQPTTPKEHDQKGQSAFCMTAPDLVCIRVLPIVNWYPFPRKKDICDIREEEKCVPRRWKSPWALVIRKRCVSWASWLGRQRSHARMALYRDVQRARSTLGVFKRYRSCSRCSPLRVSRRRSLRKVCEA